MRGFEVFAEAGGLNGCEAVVNVVEEMQIGPEFLSQASEKMGHEIQIMFGRPAIFRRRIGFGRFVMSRSVRDAVGVG